MDQGVHSNNPPAPRGPSTPPASPQQSGKEWRSRFASAKEPLRRLSNVIEIMLYNQDGLETVENLLAPELELQGQVEKLGRELDALRHAENRELEQLRADNQRLLAGNEKLVKSVEELKQTKTKLEDSVEDDRVRFGKEKQDLLKAEREKSRKRLLAVEEECKSEAQQRMKSLGERISDLEEKNAELSGFKEELEKEKATHHTAVTTLADKIDSLKLQLLEAKSRFPVHTQSPEL